MAIKPVNKRPGRDNKLVIKKLDDVVALDFSQLEYLKFLREKTLTFCDSLPGAGKTMLALVEGIKKVLKGDMEKLVYIRCYVPEIGIEKPMGALPGTVEEKLAAFRAPILDTLGPLVGPEAVNQMFEAGMIEITSVAFLRGRTLDHSFIVVDEAQQADKTILYMIISRLGRESQMAVLGSKEQIDLKKKHEGYKHRVAEALKELPNVGVVHLPTCYRNEELNEILEIMEGID
jgi:phosphate starvation-inducible PhoH-like protein